MKHTRSKQRSQGFTLIEILVVLVIIAILASILFPAFSRAKEGARQASCASNMQKIAQAVSLYYADEKRYPGSLAFLLPHVNGTGTLADYANNTTVENTYGTGYLKVSDFSFVCPDDAVDATLPRSSYGDISKDLSSGQVAPPSTSYDPGRLVWNFWGYKADGTAYPDAPTAASANTTNTLLYNTASGSTYDYQKNPVNYSLSNRFAPSSTIITHCVFHRPSFTNMAMPDPFARDIILRLDGSAKPIDISQFPTNDYWQKQGQF